MLQYITNTQSTVPVADQVRAVVRGGCKWVQIRMKDASDDEIRAVVADIKQLCIDKGVFLILNDRVELAKELNVGGVHLGKTDMLPMKARTILGPAAVIGVTANTFDDILDVRSLDIDYIGIGPFAHTTTKENLAPILGLEGVRDLSKRMLEDEINIAHVAVGGIGIKDVAPLMEAGVNGIAVSGAIALAPDIEAATRDFIETLKPFEPTPTAD